MTVVVMMMASRCKAEGNSLLVDPGQLSIVARRARQSLLDVQVTMITLVRNQRNSLDHQDCNFDLSRFRVQLFTPSSSPPPPSLPSPSPSSQSLSFCFCGDQPSARGRGGCRIWILGGHVFRLGQCPMDTTMMVVSSDSLLHPPTPPFHRGTRRQKPPSRLQNSSLSLPEVRSTTMSYLERLHCNALHPKAIFKKTRSDIYVQHISISSCDL